MSIDSGNRWVYQEVDSGAGLLVDKPAGVDAGCSRSSEKCCDGKSGSVHIEDVKSATLRHGHEPVSGPKGEVITEKTSRYISSCSTKGYVFVGCCSRQIIKRDKPYTFTIWRNRMGTAPLIRRLIDAREAFYVNCSKRKGAMGPTLASFADSKAATALPLNLVAR